jgi:hypothetical protein
MANEPPRKIVIDSLHTAKTRIEGQLRFNAASGGNRALPILRGVANGGQQRPFQRCRITGRNDQRFDTVARQFCRPTGVGRHNRTFERHGFQHGVRRAFIHRGLHEQIERVVQESHIVYLTEQTTSIAEVKLVDLSLQVAAEASVAGNQQVCMRHLSGDLGKHRNEPCEVLLRLETSDGAEHEVVR